MNDHLKSLILKRQKTFHNGGTDSGLYKFYKNAVNRGRISSVGRTLDCRAGGLGFDSRDRTNTQGRMTSKMAVPSPVGDVKNSVPN